MIASSAIRKFATDAHHPGWVALQLVASRGLVALKFFFAARMLGPEAVGLVGIALLTLAIVESLSETGLQQAIIQRPAPISRVEAGATWSLQLTRGAFVATTLAGLAAPISSFFEAPAATSLILLAALVPLVRNLVNPGLYLAQRERHFRSLASYDGTAACIDLFVTMLAIASGLGVASILVGTIAAELAKVAQTWTRFRTPLSVNLDWAAVQSLTGFGKWVWGSSVLTTALNQIDKVLVASLLGTAAFGHYQVASRLAQMLLADGAAAIGQYLYPTFSHLYRQSTQSAQQFFRVWMVRLVACGGLVAGVLVMFGDLLIAALLGHEWLAAAPVFKACAITMFVGAVIAVLVPYCRAMGRPQWVTLATVIQLLCLIPAAFVLTRMFGAAGMALAAALAGSAACAVLFLLARRRHAQP